MRAKTKPKKEKINIMGKEYKVDKSISDTLKALSEAENILKRMKEIDSQMTKEIQDKENKNEKEQGVKE